ncbi:MAG: hypothetical protein COW30_07945 [Rhodospirillales bacterium CG15_BIG_FIL_POST_REV_8_21_14_020_66_15]|nr:MAG: hypothetical protein COW30_07945 [Rhodospirillales bacterium CG15_BIG_FIL_POST_REV_8_21_14_020_66_15]
MPIGLLTALLMAPALGGCDTVSNKFLDTVSGKVQLACPPQNIVADASRRLTYRPGPGRDLTDIDNEIVITQVALTCDSNVNRNTRAGTMTVGVTTFMDAVRGPANPDRKTSIEYFVAVTDRADKVLYREGFTINLTFAENESRREVAAPPVRLTIPIQAGQTGKNFRILVGLVISREQLEINRRDRRPRL